MSQAVQIYEAFCQNLYPDTEVKSETDRREDYRPYLAYRPCCVSNGGQVYLGLIKNQSANGAMIELVDQTNVSNLFAVDETVAYFWNSETRVRAKVVWREGNRIGLANERSVDPFGAEKPFRSLRLPSAKPAKFWIGNSCHVAPIENISMGGLCVRGLPDLSIGALLTVVLGKLEICNAAVRWKEGRRTGIRFQAKLNQQDLAQLCRDKVVSSECVQFD